MALGFTTRSLALSCWNWPFRKKPQFLDPKNWELFLDTFCPNTPKIKTLVAHLKRRIWPFKGWHFSLLPMTMTRLHIHLISGHGKILCPKNPCTLPRGLSRSRNGGPGASSFIGSFTELGPYYLSEDSLKTESYRRSNKINGWGKGMWMGGMLKDEDNLLKGWVDCIIRMIFTFMKKTQFAVIHWCRFINHTLHVELLSLIWYR